MRTSKLVVRRQLTPAQAATRDQLIQVAIELASEGGYQGVSVRLIADKLGMSPATVYQHAGSKNQLLLDVLSELSRRVSRSIEKRGVLPQSPADRLLTVFTSILRQVSENPPLYRALFVAYLSASPDVDGDISELIGFGPERTPWIGAALRAGSPDAYDLERQESTARLMSTMFLGAIIGVTVGRNVNESIDLLDDAAHRLLGNACDQGKDHGSAEDGAGPRWDSAPIVDP
ncbi:TetR family transcriptional regulator [Rhodococcus sp. OK519]|uniref:TetR/AcrR family transcriptional regulator n=1 Tax=Rhodococcus sp. OK519 TaxID=2135729 RepID=UPI000D38F4AA|nr:TetR family transcriptional regulator [Rhodococcus sp. OK519]